MKKAKRILTILCACLVLCFGMLFCGCSGKTTYKLESIRLIDETDTHSYRIGDTLKGVELTKETFILVLNNDNTGFIRVFAQDETENESFKKVATLHWMKGYNKEIYLTEEDEGECWIAKKDGKKITIEIEDEIQIILTK